jgi:acetolactate synthase I/II/III large subunit
MKVSDYIAEFIKQQEVKHVFGITGGAIAHVFDSIGKCLGIEYICNQHEQASAMAADAYSRVTGNLGIALATSGPGATNLITGIGCSYFDSIPTLFITGNVSSKVSSKGTGLRQLGFQEADITQIVGPLTKYSVSISNASEIKYELEKATYIAKSERKGPVLVDVPEDIQREEINPQEMRSYIPEEKKVDFEKLGFDIEKGLALLKEAKRPLLVFGAGVRLGGCVDEARKLVEELDIPYGFTWGGKDIILGHSENFIGEFGITGSRRGNFAMQNADLIWSIGSRMEAHATGKTNYFSPNSKKIVVDIDMAELEKFKITGLHIDLPIQADVRDFFAVLRNKMSSIEIGDLSHWKEVIGVWREKYSSDYKILNKDYVNQSVFFETLSNLLNGDEIIIADTGESLPQSMNLLRLKNNQRLFSAFNNTPMGYSLPASIGASFAKPQGKIICIAGDGGMQMNLQELATIKKHDLPIKIFIFQNQGYNMIKSTQNSWLDSRYEASSSEKGIAIPDFVAIGKAYGIESIRISDDASLKEKLEKVLATPNSTICELNIVPTPTFLALKSGSALENLLPSLDKEELKKNMNYFEKE